VGGQRNDEDFGQYEYKNGYERDGLPIEVMSCLIEQEAEASDTAKPEDCKYDVLRGRGCFSRETYYQTKRDNDERNGKKVDPSTCCIVTYRQ
jgi:hypothetical protein